MERGLLPVRLVWSLGVLLLAFLAGNPLFCQSPQPLTMGVDVKRPAAYSIPRTVFGSFLEPIGNSTYNGLWAEVLQNPSFEENLWSVKAVGRLIRDEPGLERASDLGLPLPWQPLRPEQGNRYEPRWGDAANSSRSLAILGLPDAETGIKQRVYLPVHRTLRFVGSIYVKELSGHARLELSLRKSGQPASVLTRADLQTESPQWKKYSFTLTLAPGQLAQLEPADFVVSLPGGGRVLIDQASLMPSDAVDGLDPEMVRMARDMKTPLVRFGGNFTSAYHWRDGVGPHDRRISMLNVAWGMPEYNQFGTDEFLRFCQLIGAEPQIALNLGSGTPSEAAGWVRYVNDRLHRKGLLWELGNELWGNWNLGYPTLEELPHRTLDFSAAIRKIDPQARLIATGQDPDHYAKWNAAQLTNPAGTFQFLATHFVVRTDQMDDKNASPEDITRAAFALPVELGRRLRSMQAQIDQVPAFAQKTHIAFTEWLFACCNGKPVTAPRYDNVGGAIAVGGFFNMLLANADVVPVSDMTGIIEFAGIWKKRGKVFATPSYHVFRLYSTADLDTPVAVENTSPTYDVHAGVHRLPDIPRVPELDVVAATNKTGDKLTIFCVNRSLALDMPVTFRLNGFEATGTASVQTITGNGIGDVNDEEHTDAVVPQTSSAAVSGSSLTHTFRHASVTRIELRSGGANPASHP